MEIKQQELDSQHLRLPFYIIFDLRESSISRKWRRHFARRIWQGRIQDFFRRGCSRLLLYFNTNKPHIFFLQNTSCIRKPQVISGGGVRTPCTLPLNPPLVFELSIRLFYAGAKARVQALELYVKI